MSDRQYFRIMLGRAHSFVTECFDGGFIGAEDDQRIKRALSVTQNIFFMKYKVKLELSDF